MHRPTVRLALFIAVGFFLAGCFGGGSGSTKEAPYEPQFRGFDLYLFPLINGTSGDERWELYPGAKVEAWAFSPDDNPEHATIPGPEIRVREGDTVEVTFHIQGVPMPHTIHWHGLHVPWDQDGVPYVSQPPLGDRQFGGNGEFTYTYEFQIRGQSGTYWYHCHVDTQHHLDMGMYGAIIVEPADPNADPHFDQEATLFLDEWDKSHIHSNLAPDQVVSRSGDPEETLDALYGQLRDYYHMSTLTTVEGIYDAVRNNPAIPEPVRDFLTAYAGDSLLRKNRSWYPVTYPGYYAEYDTFLINGKAFPLTEPILVEPGKTLRMRVVNAGSLVHALHLHGHHMLLTHKDGYKLPAPYYADTVLLGPGERYDAYVQLDNPGPWMLHDHMPQNEQNDHINPGGMATHLCYTSGWALAENCRPDHHPHDDFVSGDVTDAMTQFFRAVHGIPVAPEYTGTHGDH